MNLTRAIKSHEQAALRLASEKKFKTARKHALQAFVLRKAKQLKSENRMERAG